MQVPAAMFIEMAKDAVEELDPDVRADQLKELEEATGNSSIPFQTGYELGLQTARVMLATNPKAIEADVSDAI